MLPLFKIFVICTIVVFYSLSEVTEDFEGRWITRPPVDQEFPYAVFVKMTFSEDATCSGSLVTLEWVLTAARCMYRNGKQVENDSSIFVYAGVGRDLNGTQVQMRTSKKLLIHNIGDNNYFSLALVKVDPFLSMYKGKMVEPMNLGNDYGFVSGVTKETCESGSFGRIEWDEERSPALKKTISVIETCNCSYSLEKSFPSSSVDQWVCGENEYNMGVCKGDFGAALKCDQGLIAVSINIVTFSDLKTCEISDLQSTKCSSISTISIYTDVCKHLEWMNSYIPTVPVNRTSCERRNSAVTYNSTSDVLLVIFVFLWPIM